MGKADLAEQIPKPWLLSAGQGLSATDHDRGLPLRSALHLLDGLEQGVQLACLALGHPRHLGFQLVQLGFLFPPDIPVCKDQGTAERESEHGRCGWQVCPALPHYTCLYLFKSKQLNRLRKKAFPH